MSVHKFLVDTAVEDKAARGCLLFGLWMCRIAKPWKMRAQYLMEFSTLTDVNSQQTYIERETIYKEKKQRGVAAMATPCASGCWIFPISSSLPILKKKKKKDQIVLFHVSASCKQ